MIRSLYISYNAITEPIVQSQVIPYLRELSKKGIKFYLLTFEKKRMGKEEKCRIQKGLKEDSKLDWYALNYHKKPTIPVTVFDIVTGCIYSIYIIIKNKIDVVHTRAIVAALMGFPAAKLLLRKFIFDTRGIDSEEYVDGGLWRRGGLKHKAVGFLENVLTKSSDYVIVLTERFLEVLREKYRGKGIKFSVIPCAVDTDKFKRKNNKDIQLANKLGIRNKFVIIYAGSLGTWYMFSEMICFFKTALKLINNAHFLILTPTDKNHVIDEIKKNNLDMKHVTIDTCAYNSMPDYLSLCNIGIFFIKPVFSKLSSSPVKFGEYLASGLPVIINHGIGDTEEIVRTNKVGVIVEGFNEHSYHKAFNELKELLKDRNLVDRCRLTAKKYLSLNAAIDKYDNIYKDLADERGAVS